MTSMFQFVPFRDFLGQRYQNDLTLSRAALAKSVLAEVPDQVLYYMKKCGIKPKPQREVTAAKAPPPMAPRGLQPQHAPEVPPGYPVGQPVEQPLAYQQGQAGYPAATAPHQGVGPGQPTQAPYPQGPGAPQGVSMPPYPQGVGSTQSGQAPYPQGGPPYPNMQQQGSAPYPTGAAASAPYPTVPPGAPQRPPPTYQQAQK